MNPKHTHQFIFSIYFKIEENQPIPQQTSPMNIPVPINPPTIQPIQPISQVTELNQTKENNEELFTEDAVIENMLTLVKYRLGKV